MSRFGLEEYGCDKIENQSLGQNRMGIVVREAKGKLK
jgi:hypothetical protein